MKILDNVLHKMQETPKFSPITADTFHDWSIESGDIISIETSGEKKTFPIFSSEIGWNGAARGTISCSGNKTRPAMRKQERAAFASAGSTLRRSAGYTDGKILEDRKELIAALGNEDGAPEDLKAGLSSYVRWDLENNKGYAESVLFAQIGEKARGEIRVYAVESDGETKTLAEILADQITLTSEVDNAKAEIGLKADEKTVETLDRRVVETEKATASLVTRLGDAEATLNQKAEAKTVSDLSGRVTDTEAAQTAIANRVADAEVALEQTVSKKTFSDAIDSQDEAIAEAQEAVANLSSRVGNAEASLTLKAESKTVTALDGRVTEVSSSVAELSADVIKLQGRVDLTGSLSVEGGRITAEKSIYTSSNVFANKFWSNSESIRLGARDYAPAEITSTTGAVFRALGA